MRYVFVAMSPTLVWLKLFQIITCCRSRTNVCVSSLAMSRVASPARSDISNTGIDNVYPIENGNGELHSTRQMVAEAAPRSSVTGGTAEAGLMYNVPPGVDQPPWINDDGNRVSVNTLICSGGAIVFESILDHFQIVLGMWAFR